MTYITEIDSPVGALIAMSGGGSLTGLYRRGSDDSPLPKHAGALDKLLPDAEEGGSLPVFAALREWLAVYFGGDVPSFTPPLAPEGTPFQREVWDALLAIPYGNTLTYGALAGRLEGRRGGGRMARAVGGAVGRNPISIIIPCHRVVASGGGLGGYAGGLEMKRYLLRLERAGAFS